MNFKRLGILLLAAVFALLAYSILNRQIPVEETNENNGNASIATPLENAEVYSHPEFGYKISIPQGFYAEEQNEYSTLFYPEEQPTGPGPANFIYVSVVTPEVRNNDQGEVYNYNPRDYQKLISLDEVGESTNFVEGEDMGQKDWFEYTFVSIDDIDGATVKNFENTKPWEFPTGTTENRYIYYTGGDSGAQIDPRIAYSVIKSFKVN